MRQRPEAGHADRRVLPALRQRAPGESPAPGADPCTPGTPQPPPAYQETDELGSETECSACGGLEKKVTPLTAVCGSCGAMRSLLVKPVRDLAREQTVLRELIAVEQQLRTRGVPPAMRVELGQRLKRLREEKKQFSVVG